MTKCKTRNCENKAMQDEKYCRYHQAKKEGRIKILISGGTTLALGAFVLVREVKDRLSK